MWCDPTQQPTRPIFEHLGVLMASNKKPIGITLLEKEVEFEGVPIDIIRGEHKDSDKLKLQVYP